MTSDLRIISAGPGCTLQDGGRHGYLRYGVTVSGPMDWLGHATANLALGRARESTAIEISLGGISVTAEEAPLTVAVAGGDFSVRYAGASLPAAVCLRLQPGVTLAIRPGSSGAWCYLAFAGDPDLPCVLGSRATHTRSHLGGYHGRALRGGDLLPIRAQPQAATDTVRIEAPWLDYDGRAIRILPGPQQDYFPDEALQALVGTEWVLGHRSDRMGYLMEGPPLAHARGFNIVSDGIALGSIQVPGNGLPIVLMADRQPTGGYPKIATVISADIGVLAQARPGDKIRFRFATLEEAVEARRQSLLRLAGPPQLQPLLRTEFPPEFLLAHNLIGGVVKG